MKSRDDGREPRIKEEQKKKKKTGEKTTRREGRGFEGEAKQKGTKISNRDNSKF